MKSTSFKNEVVPYGFVVNCILSCNVHLNLFLKKSCLLFASLVDLVRPVASVISSSFHVLLPVGTYVFCELAISKLSYEKTLCYESMLQSMAS